MKQIIIVNADIKMSPGKLAAQVAHASVGAVIDSFYGYDFTSPVYDKWVNSGSTKIVVKASEEEIREFFEKFYHTDIPNHMVFDEGRTELNNGTLTCYGIGPASNEELKATQHLKLY